MSKALAEQLRAIVAEVAEIDDPSRITDDAHLFDDLGITSMIGLEIIMEVQESLSIEVPETALYELKTFSDIVRLATRHASSCHNGTGQTS